MKLPLYWIDAFSRKPFAGNPAGVVPLTRWLSDRLMQQIAYENGLAETAFFVPVGPDQYHLRWFTPGAEVDLCGHATLATAFTLFNHLGYRGDRIIFDSRSGPLTATHLPDHRIELDFPARPAKPMEPPPALVKGLGATPVFFAQAEANLAVFDSADDIRALKPDFDTLATLEQYGTIATAPGMIATLSPDSSLPGSACRRILSLVRPIACSHPTGLAVWAKPGCGPDNCHRAAANCGASCTATA